MVICYYSSPRKLTPQVPYGHPSTLCDGAFKSQQTQWGFTCMSCAAWCLAPTAGPAGFQGSLCTCSPWRRQTEFTASSHPCPFPAPELLVGEQMWVLYWLCCWGNSRSSMWRLEWSIEPKRLTSANSLPPFGHWRSPAQFTPIFPVA